MRPRSSPPRCLAWWLAAGLWCGLPACTLFDNTVIERQRAEIERLQQESLALQQEVAALQQQRQQEDTEREACNRAFFMFDAARQAATPEEAIDRYREGLALCPTDDVAHNELGELYLQLGRKEEAAAAFREALRLNPNFSRAQKNLEAARAR
ncbi:MAG: tetratricopeptide repeat protein [Candidatus Binatia bacterium]|nr:tetratricopeptide repeat protein [Candidatus Binatia bacterium]